MSPASSSDDDRGGVWEYDVAKLELVRELRVRSRLNVLRGIHFQEPLEAPLTKVLTVERGSIFEVLVDVKTGDVDWVTVASGEPCMLVIPPWTAHGYLVMSDYAVVRYRFDAQRSVDAERRIRWDTVDVPWPFKDPVLSPADASAPPLAEVLALYA